MKRLILVGGIPGAGKTGFAWQLETLAGVLSDSADYVYKDIGKALGSTEDFPDPRIWKAVPEAKLAPLRAKFYAEHMKAFTKDVAIMEGLGVALEADRADMVAAWKPDEIIYFQVDVPFEDWLLQTKRERSAGSWKTYETLRGMLTVPNVYATGPKTSVFYMRGVHIPGRRPERFL